MKRFLGVGTLLFVCLLLAGCGPTGPALTISDGWSRPGAGSNAAFYLNIENNGEDDDSLIGAASDICGQTMIHESIIDDAGVMQMIHRMNVPVRGGETVTFAPGGLHVMCIERQADLSVGDTFTIELEFEASGTIPVTIVVREN